MSTAVTLAGHLIILAGEMPMRVEFRGDVVAVELPNLRAARALARALPRRERRHWLRRVQSVLGRAGLELQIWVGAHQVARLARVNSPGRLAAWLGFDPLELRVRAVFATLMNRRGRTSDQRVHL